MLIKERRKEEVLVFRFRIFDYAKINRQQNIREIFKVKDPIK